jgi:hypothetical protein
MKTLIAALSASLILSQTAMAGNAGAAKISNRTVTVATQNESGSEALPILLTFITFFVAMSSASGGHYASDARLKTDIKATGRSVSGVPVYRFRYKGHEQVFEGVMAQDVMKKHPAAVKKMSNGYLAVNYDMIGAKMVKIR